MNDPLAPDDRTEPDAMSIHDERAPAVTLPIVSEFVHVDKVEVDRGGYRITKHVASREVLVDEPLLHETIEIERRPLNRELPDGEVPAVRHEGDTMIVPVVKEVVVTQKRLVLVEELRITRIRETRRDPQSVAVREEHIEIERLGAETTVIRSS